jgi:hypothetical protein
LLTFFDVVGVVYCIVKFAFGIRYCRIAKFLKAFIRNVEEFFERW